MRNLTIFLLTGALVLRLSAGEQLLTVTPQSLQDWSVSGTDKRALVSARILTLPAGTQISREFSASAVILHLATRAIFSETPAEWPILDVGPAALALVKKDGKGQLVLVVDESTTEELPWDLKLEEDAATLDLFLAYDPVTGTGLVGLDDRRHAFNLPRSTKPVEVWLGAGSQAPWEQERMEVLLFAGDAVSSPGSRRSGNSDPAAARQLTAAMARLRNGTGFGEGSGGAADLAGAAPSSGPSSSTLEVFTPPAVRRARIVEVVRTVTERGLKK